MIVGDTIAAVSTPRGKGGVALLRVSGPEAFSVCEKVFRPKNGKRPEELAARTAIYGSILTPTPEGEWVVTDDGLLTLFRAPASFTGEDTAEICCHGGILLTETVLSALIAAGARAAEAGEFTRRAFLNGKLGLSSAEALANLLEAQTGSQLMLAHAGTDGLLEKKSRSIYEKLREVLASIYAVIDYPEEDLAEMSREQTETALQSVCDELETLAGTYRAGHAVAEGISTVLCGRPNVGKSSLYNRLVGRDAAIVTSTEGTTRDVLCETVALGKVTLRLSDTAGLRGCTDPVERIGVDRARRAMESAELILAVFDGSEPLREEDRSLIAELRKGSCPVIAVVNKSDRGSGSAPEIEKAFRNTVRVSADRGDGMQTLQDCVEALFLNGEIDFRRDAVLTNARQNGATLSALESVRQALHGLRRGLPEDIFCTDAEHAMQAIAELDGRSVSEDIVTEIFSHFCVGK